MNKSLKLSLGLSLVLMVLVGLFLAVGFFQKEKYSNSITETLNVPPNAIWEYLIDVQDMPNRRKEVVKVEVLESDSAKIPLVWKETTDLGGYMLFKRGATEVGKKIEMILFESSYKILGKWTYELKSENGLTKVTISEESEISSPLIRGAFFLAGRDSTLQQEMRMINNYFKEKK